MNYERMKYPHDQREWVRIADASLPELREKAIKAQHAAAEAFRDWENLPSAYRARFHGFMLDIQRERNMAAQSALNRVLYCEGMRRVNLPEG